MLRQPDASLIKKTTNNPCFCVLSAVLVGLKLRDCRQGLEGQVRLSISLWDFPILVDVIVLKLSHAAFSRCVRCLPKEKGEASNQVRDIMRSHY